MGAALFANYPGKGCQLSIGAQEDDNNDED